MLRESIVGSQSFNGLSIILSSIAYIKMQCTYNIIMHKCTLYTHFVYNNLVKRNTTTIANNTNLETKMLLNV